MADIRNVHTAVHEHLVREGAEQTAFAARIDALAAAPSAVTATDDDDGEPVIELTREEIAAVHASVYEHVANESRERARFTAALTGLCEKK